MFSCHYLAVKIARAISKKTGIDESDLENYALDQLQFAAMRFARLGKGGKFSTYAYAYVSANVARWVKSDRKGSKLVSERKHLYDPDECQKTYNSQHETSIEYAEMVTRIRSRLTRSEYDTVMRYASGERGIITADLENILAKCRMAVLPQPKGQ